MYSIWKISVKENLMSHLVDYEANFFISVFSHMNVVFFFKKNLFLLYFVSFENWSIHVIVIMPKTRLAFSQYLLNI